MISENEMIEQTNNCYSSLQNEFTNQLKSIGISEQVKILQKAIKDHSNLYKLSLENDLKNNIQANLSTNAEKIEELNIDESELSSHIIPRSSPIIVQIPSHGFEGIVHFLRKEGLMSLIEISSNSDPNKFSPTNLLRWDDSHSFTFDEPNSCVTLKFSSKISICGYALRSSRWSFPKEWKVEGMNDQNEWFLVDSQNTDHICSPFSSHLYSFEYKNDLHAIRIIQTGSNSNNGNRLVLSAIELFGTIVF